VLPNSSYNMPIQRKNYLPLYFDESQPLAIHSKNSEPGLIKKCLVNCAEMRGFERFSKAAFLGKHR